MNDELDSDFNHDPRPSKTQLKKEMHHLQQLGEQLTQLKESQIIALNLPQQLQQAIIEAKQITKFGARHRQMQFIGKIMRKIDASDIEKITTIVSDTPTNQTAILHLTERWRERLLSEDNTALTEFAREYTTADIQQIRFSIRSVLKDIASNKPAKEYRGLFRLLQKAIAEKAM